MKKVFKYDYLNRKRNICIVFLVSSILAFLFSSVILLDIRSLCFLPCIVLFALPSIAYSKKGIVLDSEKRLIIIRDDRGKYCIPIDKLVKVSIVELNKVNKGRSNSFSVLGAKEEIEMWDYVYNKGKVYNIVFKIKEDNEGYSTYKSYFGWMYKEKNEKTVNSVEKQLYDFVNIINLELKTVYVNLLNQNTATENNIH